MASRAVPKPMGRGATYVEVADKRATLKGRPFGLLALLCVARHRPGPALTGGTASSQACALAQPGHWAGLVEGLVLMTAGVGPSGDHFWRSRPGPVSARRADQYGRAV